MEHVSYSLFPPFFHPFWIIFAKERHSRFHAAIDYSAFLKIFFEVLAILLKARQTCNDPF